ncbi:hypothetical protein CERSUDRAFT_109815 [Gelatoporia subvermispora B]|uniref:Uncharacterized protein n=1 Tax=Ceriporiopsis subvermispora (strain B) TaxID=914234 RepID=M2PWI6_CERS8|nr:hypothetical protein CERSUDRAFT_109815 [Gelatoporia subvermispora B]
MLARDVVLAESEPLKISLSQQLCLLPLRSDHWKIGHGAIDALARTYHSRHTPGGSTARTAQCQAS